MLNAALAAISGDKQLVVTPINFHSSDQSAWWLMDTVVTNDDPNLRDAQNNPMDIDTRNLRSDATIDVYSVFEPQLLDDLAKTVPLFLLPDTFASQAIEVIGPWSDVLDHLPREADAPEVDADGRIFNLRRPMSRYFYQVQRLDEDGAPEPASSATSGRPPKRPRAPKPGMPPPPPVGRATPVPAGIAPAQAQQEPAGGYRIRKVIRYYDSMLYENMPRGDTLANFSAINIAEKD